MPYFNYHATAKHLILEGKLKHFYFCEEYNGIRPALVLIFDDARHPIMPIRQHKFAEYFDLLEQRQLRQPKENKKSD